MLSVSKNSKLLVHILKSILCNIFDIMHKLMIFPEIFGGGWRAILNRDPLFYYICRLNGEIF